MKQTQTDFNKKDVYGVLQEDLEVDSDVNEDHNREELLDESLAEFMEVFKIERKQK